MHTRAAEGVAQPTSALVASCSGPVCRFFFFFHIDLCVRAVVPCDLAEPCSASPYLTDRLALYPVLPSQHEAPRLSACVVGTPLCPANAILKIFPLTAPHRSANQPQQQQCLPRPSTGIDGSALKSFCSTLVSANRLRPAVVWRRRALLSCIQPPARQPALPRRCSGLASSLPMHDSDTEKQHALAVACPWSGAVVGSCTPPAFAPPARHPSSLDPAIAHARPLPKTTLTLPCNTCRGHHLQHLLRKRRPGKPSSPYPLLRSVASLRHRNHAAFPAVCSRARVITGSADLDFVRKSSSHSLPNRAPLMPFCPFLNPVASLLTFPARHATRPPDPRPKCPPTPAPITHGSSIRMRSTVSQNLLATRGMIRLSRT